MTKKTFDNPSMQEALEAYTASPAIADPDLVVEALQETGQLPAPPSPVPPAVLYASEHAMENSYQSSAVLMRQLADSIMDWRQQLPDNAQPAVMAILQGGRQIKVHRLSQESFHGIRIEGTLNDMPCMLLAHQATVQMLCYVEKLPKGTTQRKIGFIIEGEETEA
ncbi:MAG: hypothetical protein ACPGSM_09025 [Thiolinea sp.]